MADIFQEIRDQIHELRNALAPVDFRLANFEHEIEECRKYYEQKTLAIEARVFANAFKLEEQGNKISTILERLHWIEVALKVPQMPEPEKSQPTNAGEVTQAAPPGPALEKAQ